MSEGPPTTRRPAAPPRAAGELPGNPDPALHQAFAGLFGLVLGLGLLKFGNPVILDHLVGTPSSLQEWRIFAWPARIGYALLAGVFLLGIIVIGRRWRPEMPWAIPLLLTLWLVWQGVAAAANPATHAASAILPQFVACAACFTLGHLALPRVAESRTFWLCLVAGFLGVLGMAADQRFGGLEATRKMILESPEAHRLPAEYLARIQSNRVFSTLVYPNALAGAVLLLLPLAATLAWSAGSRWGRRGSSTLAAAMLVAGLAVLIWSGSKAGWLIALGMAVLALWWSTIPSRWKAGLSAACLILGVAAFALLYAERLSRGATSVAARMDYWTAAVHGWREHPWTGHGPGGFKRVYSRVKSPESEMAQLAHNDYLQQATDSGIPGFLAYGGFVLLALTRIARHAPKLRGAALGTALGLVGWFAQGLLEFGLYIPATSWCAFALLGWSLAQKPSPADSRAGTLPTACASSS